MAYVIGMTSGGGVPLFTRTIGDFDALPFPTIGSLNGVHMFTESHGVKLLSTQTQNAKIVWQVFHDSITLIIVTVDDGESDTHIKMLLQFIYNAMVMFLGESELKSLRNVERLKKELKGIYFLIDRLLEESVLIGHITGCLDVTAFTDLNPLKDCLEAFTGWCNTEFGCVLIHNKVAVATSRWWNLPPGDSILLSVLISAMSYSATKDIAIYLPNMFPDVPHRLLAFQIMDGMEICVLCGSTPAHNDVSQKIIEEYWRSAVDALKNDMRYATRSIPPSSLDHGILGFIFINKATCKCLASFVKSLTGLDEVLSPASDNPIVTEKQRRDILVTFYKSVVDSLFPTVYEAHEADINQFDEKNAPCETYVCSNDYKLHALRKYNHQLFVLYSKDVPTYALSQITMEALELFCQESFI